MGREQETVNNSAANIPTFIAAATRFTISLGIIPLWDSVASEIGVFPTAADWPLSLVQVLSAAQRSPL